MNRLTAVCFFLATACSDQSVKAFNAAPEATITSPGDGTGVDSEVPLTLMGRVGDPDDSTADLTVYWRVGSELACDGQPPESGGTSNCEVVLTEATTVSLEVVDPSGAAGVDTIELTLDPTAVPTAQITEPVATGVYYSDQLITFEGVLSDAEDEPGALSAAWTSSVDGALDLIDTPDSDGTIRGAQLLNEGEHLIELQVTDTTGKTGSDSVVIRVGPPNSAPTCTVTAPADGTQVGVGEVVLFEATLDDVDIAEDDLSVRWSSDRDGELGTSTPTSAGEVTFPWSDLSANTHVVSMTVTDELGLTCTDQVLVTVGSPPSIELTAPAAGARFNEGEPITLAAIASDAEDGPTELLVDWSTDLDGPLSQTTPDAAGTTTLTHDHLLVGEHLLTITVTDTDGLTDTDSLRFTINGLPSAPTVSIEPDPAATGDDLTATIDVDSLDPEGDPVTYQYAWTRDGTPTAHTTATVPAADTARGELWSVAVTPNDGSGDGAIGTAQITIANTAPVATSLVLTPDPAHTDDTLIATVTASDADGDPLSYSWAWTVDGVAATSTASTLDGSAFSKDQVIVVTVTPNDGTDTGAALSSTGLTIANTPPEAPTVSIDPTDPTENDDLICTVDTDSFDADGDSIAYSMAWTVDGVAWSGTTTTTTWTDDTISSALTTVGETWRCTATPHDGDDSGSTATAEATIQNAYDGWTSTDVTPSDAEWSFYGNSSSDRLSGMTAGAGDADGDGLADVVLGSNQDSVGGATAGATYFFSGDTLLANPGSHTASTLADVTLLGEAAGDQSGLTHAFLGDIDGDGLDDLAISAAGSDANGSGSGAIYVVTGDTLATLSASTTLADADWRIHGESAGDNLAEVHPSGDMDGDGHADLLMGARYDDEGGSDAGAGYLMYSSGLGSSFAVDVGTSDLKFVGEEGGDTTGGFVRGGGDVDGDGDNDVAINSWYADRAGYRAGRGYVVLAASFPSSGTMDLSNADYIFDGETSSDYAGHRITIDGDPDGDGQSDVLLSAYFNDDAGSNAGKVYLFAGASLTAGATGTRSITSADHTWTGAGTDDQLGTGLGYAGDIDGDGLDDLILSAKYNDAGTTNAGTSYLLLASGLGSGGSASVNSAYDHRFVGRTASAQCGLWGANAGAPGDIDGDGLDDVQLSCPYSSAASSSAGAVHLYLTP